MFSNWFKRESQLHLSEKRTGYINDQSPGLGQRSQREISQDSRDIPQSKNVSEAVTNLPILVLSSCSTSVWLSLSAFFLPELLKNEFVLKVYVSEFVWNLFCFEIFQYSAALMDTSFQQNFSLVILNFTKKKCCNDINLLSDLKKIVLSTNSINFFVVDNWLLIMPENIAQMQINFTSFKAAN